MYATLDELTEMYVQRSLIFPQSEQLKMASFFFSNVDMMIIMRIVSAIFLFCLFFLYSLIFVMEKERWTKNKYEHVNYSDKI